MRKTDKTTKTTTFFCDRCKKQFAESKPFENSGDNKVSRGVTIPFPELRRGKIEFKHKDFCGDCVLGLDAWAKKGK